MAILDTFDKKYAVISSVPTSSVKVTLNLQKILDLSRTTVGDFGYSRQSVVR
jgi:hypothetical protein